MKISRYMLLFALFYGSVGFSQDKSLETIKQIRTEALVKAFNREPEKIIQPLSDKNVLLGKIDGRVDVNTKSKFSYYVHIDNMNDVKSSMLLIPMATSRYTPTYYQTDEWWDANKHEIERARAEGRPTPKQDMNEVAAWLQEMKLSTNPDVLLIDMVRNTSHRKPLQTFLLEHYINHYVKDGFITLYRGAERAGEIESWNNKSVPKGARYWTPTANYAWRYARKNHNFLDELVLGRTPIFKFKVPVQDFIAMVDRKWPKLTLGTELTKNAHNYFESRGVFADHLAEGMPFLGEGQYGVEFEIRSNRAGAEEMVRYYDGSVDIKELAQDRIKVLEKTKERILKKLGDTQQARDIEAKFDNRIKNVKFEEKTITDILLGVDKNVILKNFKNMHRYSSEIANIDGLHFESWVESALQKRDQGLIKMTKPVLSEKSKKSKTKTEAMMCKGLFS